MSKYILDTKTYDTIKKYNSEKDATILKNRIDKLENENVIVTNTGVVSSGKSSLFNAILNIPERFAVGAARTTVAKDIESFIPGVDFIDTPGIDVKEVDDKLAFEAISTASIVVMVHNIKMGMLQQNEVDWIKRIVELFDSPEEIADRFIFVNSWSDQRMHEKSFSATVDETKRILFDTLGTDNIEIVNVSSTLYIKGMGENKKKLIEVSQIPYLKTIITEKAKNFKEKYGVKKQKKEIIGLVENNINVLSSCKKSKDEQKKDRIDEIYIEYENKKSKLKKAIEQYRKELTIYKSISVE